MLNTRALSYLSEVIRRGSLRKAATYLGIDVSAISRQIRYLEEQLGTQLLERHAGGIKVIRYGLTRDWVMGLKVVTGTGECFTTFSATLPNLNVPLSPRVAITTRSTFSCSMRFRITAAGSPTATCLI